VERSDWLKKAIWNTSARVLHSGTIQSNGAELRAEREKSDWLKKAIWNTSARVLHSGTIQQVQNADGSSVLKKQFRNNHQWIAHIICAIFFLLYLK
jgi:hypothetical protein